MSPRGTQLKEDVWLIHVEADQQQSCCAVETPVTMSAGAVDPTIAVTKRHD